MRDETVARSYAEALFELGERHEGVEAYGEGIETVAVLIDENDDFRRFLDTPRIALAKKKELVRSVFADRVPARLVNFVLITLDKRRQKLLRVIAREYRSIMDVHFNRIHIEVTLARAMDEQSVIPVPFNDRIEQPAGGILANGHTRSQVLTDSRFYDRVARGMGQVQGAREDAVVL